jgi:hypothetical protein
MENLSALQPEKRVISWKNMADAEGVSAAHDKCHTSKYAIGIDPFHLSHGGVASHNKNSSAAATSCSKHSVGMERACLARIKGHVTQLEL